MLVLHRKEQESVYLDLREVGLGMVRILIVEYRRGQIRVGIEADARIPIVREELLNEEQRNFTPGEGEAK